jgi:hypothetical protein
LSTCFHVFLVGYLFCAKLFLCKEEKAMKAEVKARKTKKSTQKNEASL